MNKEKCNTCNYENGEHHSLCPENIVNSDAYQYQTIQVEEN
jgi:hypothetical protein